MRTGNNKTSANGDMMRKHTMIAGFAVLLLTAPSANAGRDATCESVAQAVNTGDEFVIEQELVEAEFLTCAQAVPLYMQLLDDSRYRVREVAAWKIARMPPIAAAVVMQSIARVSSNNAQDVEYGADALGTFRATKTIGLLGTALAKSFPANTK